MIIKKITKFTVIGLLVLSVSSPALADPIIIVSYGTTDLVDGGRSYNFEIDYVSCTPADPMDMYDPCVFNGGTLDSFDIVFPAEGIDNGFVSTFTTEVNSVVGIDATRSTPGWDLVFVDAPSPSAGFGALAQIDSLTLPSLVAPPPLTTIKFTIDVLSSFIGSPSAPVFSFFTFDFYDPMYMENVFSGLLYDVIAGPMDALNGVILVPEPGTLTLFGLGLLGMAAARRRKI